ncbi:MAG: tail fiber domain-containing protein [Bacteroidales bacterium]|nr:tail fiber domain-containing protein [Bacteroidales bacterium]
MKTKVLNTIGILALAASIHTANAQTSMPNTFSYQAVITAEDGTPVRNHDITVEVSIRQGDCETNTETNTSCPVLWQELHAPTTNEFGSFSIEIGDNNAINTTAGSLSKYSEINWLDTKNGFYYLQVRVDFGEATYLNGMTDLGTTRFSSVPYALAAEKADSANAIATDANGNIANKLGQLADVTITTPKANQILVYDATINSWKNTDPATAQGLTNINISSPKTGDYLVYNETNGKWENKAMETSALNDLSDVTIGTTINSSDILLYNSNSETWENKTFKLSTIPDVSKKDATDGQVLTYNADTKLWEAQDAATGGETTTTIASLGDVEISTSPTDGQILKFDNSSSKWVNADPSASDIWQTNSGKTLTYTSYNKVGIGTDEPATLLHIKGGSSNTMLNGGGITLGFSEDRCTGSGIIAMGGTYDNNEKKISQGSACIVGHGSYVGGGDGSKNIIIMGNQSYSNSAESLIIIGQDCSAAGINIALFGQGLTANSSQNQLICGTYNKPSTNALFVVGNGTDKKTKQNNAFVINKDGTATLSGANLSSDARLKKSITNMPSALEDLLKLDGVTFKWNKTINPNASDKTQYGFIAQEVEKVFPDLVGTDSNGYKTVNYIGVIPVLTEAIKTQQEEIEDLKEENEQLKSTLEQLLKRVEALEKK